MSAPVITTIVLTYRRPKLLRRALRSVLEQTFRDLIVWVYDDASGDETAEVVSAIAARDSRVQYFCHATNMGAVANYNYALAHVTTPYFSMVSDDDLLMPEFYEHAMRAFDSHPAAGCFCAKTVIHDSVHKWFRRKPVSWQNGYHEVSTENILHMVRDHFTTTAVVFKAEVTGTVGPLNRFASDHIYMTQVAAAYPFVVSDYEAGIFMVHPSSFTGRKSLNLESKGSGAIEATQEWLLLFMTTLLDLTGRSVVERMRFFYEIHRSVARHSSVTVEELWRMGESGTSRLGSGNCSSSAFL